MSICPKGCGVSCVTYHCDISIITDWMLRRSNVYCWWCL